MAVPAGPPLIVPLTLVRTSATATIITVPDAVEVQNRGRLPIGRFELTTEGRIDPAKSTARIDLWNAEAQGTLVTDKGSVAWRIFTHATERVGVIEVKSSGGETKVALDFIAEDAVSPRESRLPADLREQRAPNPKPLACSQR